MTDDRHDDYPPGYLQEQAEKDAMIEEIDPTMARRLERDRYEAAHAGDRDPYPGGGISGPRAEDKTGSKLSDRERLEKLEEVYQRAWTHEQRAMVAEMDRLRAAVAAEEDTLPCLALRQIPTRRIQTCTLDDHPETGHDEDAHDWVDADHRIVSAFEFGQAIQAGQMYAAVHGSTETTTETFTAELESDDRQVALQAAVDLQVARLRGGMSMTWKDAQLAVLGGAREFLEFLEENPPEATEVAR